jgi:hypothetical protein
MIRQQTPTGLQQTPANAAAPGMGGRHPRSTPANNPDGHCTPCSPLHSRSSETYLGGFNP